MKTTSTFRERILLIAAGLAGFVLIASIAMYYMIMVPPDRYYAGKNKQPALKTVLHVRESPYCPYISEVVNDVPVALFRFQEDFQSPDAYDMLGNRKAKLGSSSELGGPAAVNCHSSSSLSLQGSGSPTQVTFDNNINTPTFTIEVWAKHIQGQQGNVITSGHGEKNGYSIYISKAGKEGSVWTASCGGTHGRRELGGIPVKSDTWQHLAATYDGKFFKFYVDGKHVGEVKEAKCKPSVAGPLFVGGGETQGTAVVGHLGEMAYYAHAVDGSRIETHFQHAKSKLYG